MNKQQLWAILVCFVGLLGATSAEAATVQVPKAYFPFWNSEIQGRNNCYNYSTNVANGTYAQPGSASGKEYTDINCADVHAAAVRDGLVPTERFPYIAKPGETLIALVMAVDYDFHWIRRDEGGTWSHKPGGGPARKIEDPAILLPSPYTELCGYFRVASEPTTEDEQNSGTSRIGRPIGNWYNGSRAVTSDAEVLLYSGRPNPRLSLRDTLSGIPATALRELRESLKSAPALVTPASTGTGLGYRGVRIVDREGLLLPRGTAALLKDGTLTLESPGRSALKRAYQAPLLSDLESRLRAEALFRH